MIWFGTTKPISNSLSVEQTLFTLAHLSIESAQNTLGTRETPE